MLLDAIRTAIRFGRCKLHDAAVLSQMESAEMVEGKWIVKVGHDDIMMCFHPDTLILSASGLVEIPLLNSGDVLWSHDGSLNEILATSHRMVDDDLVCIKSIGSHRLLKSTGNHPIYVSRYEWRKRGTKTRKKLLVEEPNWKAAENIKVGDYLLVPKRHNLPSSMFTDDQLSVMGWYLAEGSIERNNIVSFCLHESEFDVADNLAKILVSLDPPLPKFAAGRFYHRLAPKVRRVKGKKAIKLSYRSDSWAALLLLHCGRNSYDKELSSDAFYARNLLPLVKAYIDGDGCRASGSNREHLRVSSMSYKLISQIRQILIDNGIWSTVCQGKSQLIFHLHMSPEYFLLLGEMKKHKVVTRKFERRYVVETNEGFWTPVRHITRQHYRGLVYNLKISKVESYIAEGYAVHNCAMIGWLVGEQYHIAGMASSKQLDIEGDVTNPRLDEDKKVIASADPDVQMMVRNHWHRIMRYTKHGPPKAGYGLDGV